MDASIHFVTITLLSLIIYNCSAQNNDNPKYLGEEYGRFDLAKVTFNENIDTLFAKIDPIKRVMDYGQLNPDSNRFVVSDDSGAYE